MAVEREICLVLALRHRTVGGIIEQSILLTGVRFGTRGFKNEEGAQLHVASEWRGSILHFDGA